MLLAGAEANGPAETIEGGDGAELGVGDAGEPAAQEDEAIAVEAEDAVARGKSVLGTGAANNVTLAQAMIWAGHADRLLGEDPIGMVWGS